MQLVKVKGYSKTFFTIYNKILDSLIVTSTQDTKKIFKAFGFGNAKLGQFKKSPALL